MAPMMQPDVIGAVHVLLALRQFVPQTQASVVQLYPSATQVVRVRHVAEFDTPAHDWHVSGSESASVPQSVVNGAKASAGQAVKPLPSQYSDTSHSLIAVRQMCVAAAYQRSVGQLVLEPLHDSGASQTPLAYSARQTFGVCPAPGPFNRSAGHATPEPLHDSAGSQSPCDARHSPLIRYASAGQIVLLPVQYSIASHTPPAARQTVLGLA